MTFEQNRELTDALSALWNAGGYMKESGVGMDAADLLVNEAYAARAGNGRIVITASGRLAAGALREKAARRI